MANGMQSEDDNRKLQDMIGERNDYLIKLASTMFDKSKAYANLIIMAGYAGFFGLWSITKDSLTPKQVLWSALFILISLSSFVIFETVKMMFNARFMISIENPLKKLPNAQNIDDFLNILKDFDKTTESRNMKFIRFWVISNRITIPTALIGVSILMYSFIVNLLALYNHC